MMEAQARENNIPMMKNHNDKNATINKLTSLRYLLLGIFILSSA